MPKGNLIVKGRFEWFAEKDELNVKNHGLSFEQALVVFDDVHFFEIYDEAHSSAEQTRYIGLGAEKSTFCVVQVAFTESKRVHLISARYATAQERRLYHGRIRETFRGV